MLRDDPEKRKGGSTPLAVLRFDKLTVPRKIEGETVGYLKGRFLPAYAESPGRQLVDECEERVPSEALAKEGMLRRVTPKHG